MGRENGGYQQFGIEHMPPKNRLNHLKRDARLLMATSLCTLGQFRPKQNMNTLQWSAAQIAGKIRGGFGVDARPYEKI